MSRAPRLELAPARRAVFLSDLHLGSSNCHADALATYLESLRCERLYLVGDIVDLWWLSKRRASWGRDHTRVFAALRAHAAAGVQVTYIPGNHDRPVRQFCGLGLPNAQVRRRTVHVTADGRRLLVTHGDEHDAVTQLGGWSERLGDRLYDGILAGNRLTKQVRQKLGLRYWSLADYLKRKSAAAERYIARYVTAAVTDAARRGLDGVVCGHIHRPALEIAAGGIIYANDGDWVESLTAIEETSDGALELVRWNGRATERMVRLEPLAKSPVDQLEQRLREHVAAH